MLCAEASVKLPVVVAFTGLEILYCDHYATYVRLHSRELYDAIQGHVLKTSGVR